MHIPKRIIRLAKDRALASFSMLAEQTVVEADALATRAMTDASSADLRNLNAVRGFLRGEGRALRERMDRHFAALLERSMVTMHAQRLPPSQQIDYGALTLIDDDIVMRQIDVERMAGRLQAAESAPLGRVNLTIALMHNEREARERENPFRPYLLARALHDALRELMFDEALSKLLYDALGQAMANRLPGFYGAILAVFESGGVSARLTARPAAMSRAERERLAWQMAARQLAGAPLLDHPERALHERLLSKLQRLRDIGQAGGDGAGTRQHDLLDVIWNIFHQPLGAPAALAARGGQRVALDEALLALQRGVAAGARAPAPLSLREQVKDLFEEPEQELTLDICALLFESIIHDDILSESMRERFLPLFLPFARAVLLEPRIMHDASHPVRRLIDRLGSLGAGGAPDLPSMAPLEPAIEATVGAVLNQFEDDTQIFARADQVLGRHVEAKLATIVPGVALCAEAVAEAAADSARLAGAGVALSAALQPLQVDPRLADFILGTWARVLSHPGPGATAAFAMLPELLWSAQEKATPEERSALMRMLPELVKKVREGMASISLPEAPSKAAFDRLVAVHMDVLGGKQEVARRRMMLDQFRDHFRDVAIEEGAGGKDGWVGGFELEAALARRGVAATLHAKAAARLAQGSDAELLAWARPGTPFEIEVDQQFLPALLCAAPAADSAFLFTIAGLPQPVIYLHDPLLEAMEQGSMRPLENAPLFERAVESLMAGAESLSS